MKARKDAQNVQWTEYASSMGHYESVKSKSCECRMGGISQ